MKRTRIVGLALVAAVALSVAASSATASPVFYTKVEVGATASTAVKFTGTLGFVFLEGNVSKTGIECSAGTVTGEVTGPTTTQNVVVIFKACKLGDGATCTSAGESDGSIKTNVLKGELGDVRPGVPGLRLLNEATSRGGAFAAFACVGGAVGVKMRGSLIGQLSGACGNTVSEGKFVASQKLSFAQKGGVQKFTEFVGEEAMEQLESKWGEGAYEKSGLVGVATLKAEGVSNLGFTK
jgi:hypothetical protein